MVEDQKKEIIKGDSRLLVSDLQVGVFKKALYVGHEVAVKLIWLVVFWRLTCEQVALVDGYYLILVYRCIHVEGRHLRLRSPPTDAAACGGNLFGNGALNWVSN